MEEIIEKAASELQIDKSLWSLTKFGDIAIQQKQSVDRDNTELTRYVKGEHMGSEDLHLREWGELTDEYLGPAFIRKFEKGDILYGSRRTYLRKVVIAPFKGITSNTTFVIKANEKRIDKRLLPFIMMSEGFTDNSIKNSKGSVNPYINWKDIANYEFLLPPKDQQAELAELLWAMDEVIEREKALNEVTINTKRSFFKKYRSATNYKPLSYFCSVSYGLGQPPPKDENGVPMIRATDISKGKIDTENFLRISSKGIPKGRDVQLSKGDIIIVRSGAYTGDLAMITKECEGAVAGYDLVIRSDERKINPIWLQEYLLEKEAQNYYNGESIRSAQPHLNSRQVLETLIPYHSIEIQNRVSDYLKNFYKCLESSNRKIMVSKALQKSLINQIF
ncbi:MAG: restriction endonuclease subunit S [Saprospiraceae bacterium]|nr:restriction endonuclease subunit S [Saprospiraceae bacterium]